MSLKSISTKIETIQKDLHDIIQEFEELLIGMPSTNTETKTNQSTLPK